MTISYIHDKGEANKPRQGIDGRAKVQDIPDESLQEAISRHPAAWLLMTRPRHNQVREFGTT